MNMTAQELKSRLDRGEKITVVDVREPDEYDICHLTEAKRIPLKKLSTAIGELNPNDAIVLYCHLGIRSAQAALWLKQNGFKNTWSLEGGIDAWAEAIDSSMERY